MSIKKALVKRTAISAALAIGFVSPAVWSVDHNGIGTNPTGSPSSSMNRSGQSNVIDNNGLGNKTADEISGMEVINTDNGEQIGSVQEVVSDKNTRDLCAVIAVDQVMDLIGGKKVVVPLSELELKDDKLQISATEKALKNRAEYDESAFYQIKETDRPVSEFARMEATE